MFILIFILIHATAIFIVTKVINKRFEKHLEAIHEFYDFRNWLIENLDNPFMSDQKWRELLPMCHFADERFRVLYRPLEYKYSSEYLVLSIIAQGEEKPHDAL
jgi:hypothetical protein